jgi:hypothetical protein
LARSPLVAQATRDLSKYFQAITDGTFIDRSWSINTAQDARSASLIAGGERQIAASVAIRKLGEENTAGTNEAENIANLINGAVGIGPFFNIMNDKIPDRYKDEFKFFKSPSDTKTPKFVMKDLVATEFPFDKVGTNETPSKSAPNIYAVNVYNPYLGPTTRDSGPAEIFMNAIPTLEFSRCVPFINFELITTRKESGNSPPPPSLSMIGFLNPAQQGSADTAMLRGQIEGVRSEVLDLGPGTRSGIELFTMPQTLVNLGPTGDEFVPVIDRFRPLASLDNLSLSTKMQGGTLSFTTGKIEITVFERSRLREVAAFVRPDLYGTTFLDITHGWSHPDGGRDSNNAFGKFLDALKTETRYRVSNSSFSFEDGGKIKISLSIQSVGSIDFLYLGPRSNSIESREMAELCRVLNERISELKGRQTSPDMTALTTLSSYGDPAAVMTASINADTLKEIKNAVKKLGDAVVSAQIDALFGEITGKGNLANGDDGAVERNRAKTIKKYKEIINSLPSFGGNEDPLAADFVARGRLPLLNSSEVIIADTQAKEKISQGADDKGQDGYVSYGSVFMKMVVEPMQLSGQYDEIQTIFYPFNDHAGAVHQLPISCFPIEKDRFVKAFEELSKGSPELSLRDVIKVLQERFVGFVASRAYLMAGFYDKNKMDEGIAEEAEPKFTFTKFETPEIKTLRDTANKTKADAKTKIATAAAAGATPEQDQAAIDASVAEADAAKAARKAETGYKSINKTLTFEQRLLTAGILDKKWVMPKVEVAVEASKLLDTNGAPVVDSKGNTKTLLKIHVYDSSMDPHSTLTDIIMSANDKGMGVIAAPIAAYNAATITGTGESKKNVAVEAIQAGINAGILKEIDLSTGFSTSAAGNVDLSGTKYYAIADNYDSVKRFISAGMPSIIYGSSMSAITSANLTTGGNAAMANVLLQRAFAPPGETSPDNIDSGVPMQIIPAALSISTFGCPLFYPMQRFFVDFGTGTSLDNVYYVISTDTNIGSGGYKTDVKFAYSAGFATFTSLNQNLAMIAARFAEHSDATARAEAAAALNPPPQDVITRNEALLAKQFKYASIDVLVAAAYLQNNIQIAVEAEAKRLESAALAKTAEIEAELIELGEKASGELGVKAREAQVAARTELLAAQKKVEEAASYAAQAKIITEKLNQIKSAASVLDIKVIETIAAEIKAAQAEEKKYADANKAIADAAKAKK